MFELGFTLVFSKISSEAQCSGCSHLARALWPAGKPSCSSQPCTPHRGCLVYPESGYDVVWVYVSYWSYLNINREKQTLSLENNP